MLRRLLSILLFGAFLLPFLAPMLSMGAQAESQLPACCRRNGKHHCAMSAEAIATLTGAGDQHRSFRAPLEKCPCQQRLAGATHHELSAATAAATTRIALLQEPSAVAQAECLRRIAFDRSRQKRGPPATQLS
jgi:hypothetical protein